MINDRVYGRGAADMKAFIGIVMAQLRAMQETQLVAPLHVALSYDAEVGCLGDVGMSGCRDVGMSADPQRRGSELSLAWIRNRFLPRCNDAYGRLLKEMKSEHADVDIVLTTLARVPGLACEKMLKEIIATA
jgi:hypothetical protein